MPSRMRPEPRVMQGVVPCLDLRGRMDHGSVPGMTGTPGQLLHARVEINGGAPRMTDDGDAAGDVAAGPMPSGPLHLVVGDGRAWWERAVAAGCTLAIPFEAQPRGDDWGPLRDPFGIQRAILQPGPEGRCGMTPAIRTCLWFRDGRSPEVAAFWCSLTPGSRAERVFRADPGMGSVSVTDFVLAGVPHRILDAGPMFALTEAVSIPVRTEDEAESDRLWFALTEGGEGSACGWLKDRYGVSRQVVPRRLTELTMNPHREIAAKAMAAMMTQGRIDIAAIEAAVAA